MMGLVSCPLGLYAPFFEELWVFAKTKGLAGLDGVLPHVAVGIDGIAVASGDDDGACSC